MSARRAGTRVVMRELVILSIGLASFAAPARAQQPLIVTERAGVILNPVKPDSTAEFEAGLAQLRTALAATSDPVRKQQARGWKIYRAEEPIGANVLYVFVLDPAVPGADYSLKSILEESLPAADAETALRRLVGSLAGAQKVLSMRLTPPEPTTRPGRLDQVSAWPLSPGRKRGGRVSVVTACLILHSRCLPTADSMRRTDGFPVYEVPHAESR